jgi:hypothetical protein
LQTEKDQIGRMAIAALEDYQSILHKTPHYRAGLCDPV